MSKIKSKYKKIKKTKSRGGIEKGAIFVVVFLMTLIFGSYLFVGGTMPTKIPQQSNNLVGIVPFTTHTPENSLQMYTLKGVTLTPIPTTAPPVEPSLSVPNIEANCPSLQGKQDPGILLAYRVAATNASSNKPSIQAFYTADRALPAGNTAMKILPIDSNLLNNVLFNNAKDQNKFPKSPAVFVTNITNNANDTSGDAQNGGIPQFPSQIYGAWKTETGSESQAPNGLTLGTNADTWPASNVQPGPNGRKTTWSAEVIWDLTNLKTNTGQSLIKGNTYRFQLEIHDGQADPAVSQVCFTAVAP